MANQNQQSMFETDYAEEGLPEAEDYNPDALGTVETRAGEPEQQWEQFGLELVPIEYRSITAGDAKPDGWEDTGRRLVARNGKFISDVSKNYKLLPNERLISTANDVARDLGAEPFHQFDGDWYAQLDDHVFQDKERRRVHGLYAWQDGDVGGDEMSYGFAVHNSIDGSLGFSVGLFTFRHACANMVFMGTGGSEESRALSVESEREVVNRTTHQHTKGLVVEKEGLEQIIKGTLTLVDDVHDTYKQWVSERLEPETVRDLLQRPTLGKKDLPNWIADSRTKDEREADPIDDVLSAIEEATEDETDEGEDLPWERQAEIIEARIPTATTKWEAYNDITANLWHDGRANDMSRQNKMKDLHRVMNPAEAGDTEATVR